MSTEPLSAALPKSFLRPCLLLLLREHSAHGYELLERISAFGLPTSDPGGLYRALRSLEEEALVHSAWEPSEVGPQRRIYEITRLGMEELHRWAHAVEAGRVGLEVFLSRYQEFVALERDPATARERR